MDAQDPTREFSRYHRPGGFQGLELLTAHFHGYEFVPHVHEGYGVALIESGAERFHYRGAEHIAPCGTVAVLNPDEVHTGRRASESGWSYRVFYPPAALFRQLAQGMDGWTGGTPYFPEVLVTDPALVTPLRELHLALTTASSLLEQESRWCEAMGLLLRRHGRGLAFKESHGHSLDAASKVRELLRERIEEPVSLSWLAAETGLSGWHLNRLFRQRYGLPTHAYQLHLRLARARLWLQSPMPVAEIAARLGFADQAHFSRHFKRAVGVTPVAYRNLA